MRKLLLAMLLILLIQPVVAEENIADLKITHMPVFVQAGTPLDFSYSTGNRVGPACTAQINYWIEEKGEKISQGSDSVFLLPGEVEQSGASMLLPSKLDGVYDFFIEMKCNDATVLANKTIEAKEIIPTLPLATGLQITKGDEGKQSEFQYLIQSNSEAVVPIHIKEQILQEGQVVWSNTQNIPVSGNLAIERFGPVLSLGSYTLIVEATYGIEKATIVREFEVKAVTQPFPWLQIFAVGLLMLVMAGAAYTTVRFWANRKQTVGTMLAGKIGSVKGRVFPVEAEASGVLEEFEMNSLLEDAGIKEKKREKALWFGEKTPVSQLVQGCIVTDSSNRMACETYVTATISNNTNRNWTKVVLLASIPEFLSEVLEEIESEAEMKIVNGTSVVRFLIPKIGAMQKASVSYKVPRMISQAEANTVSLPVVTRYKEGKPLVMVQVRVEVSNEEKKQAEALKRAVEKETVKKSSKKRGKRKN